MRAILLDFPEYGIGIARSLRGRGVAATIISDKRWATASRWTEGVLLRDPQRAREEWLEQLEHQADRGPGVVLSGSDVAAEFLVRERDLIPPELRTFEAPEGAHLALMDKGSLYEIAERAGVRYPWTLHLNSAADLEDVAAEARYPCVLKPALSHLWRALFGERRVILLNGPDDLRREAAPALEAGLALL